MTFLAWSVLVLLGVCLGMGFAMRVCHSRPAVLYALDAAQGLCVFLFVCAAALLASGVVIGGAK